MLEQSLSSFEGFCEILGLGKVGEYLKSHRVHEIQDWGTIQLDAEGLAIQSELSDRFRVSGADLSKRKKTLTFENSLSLCDQPRLSLELRPIV